MTVEASLLPGLHCTQPVLALSRPRPSVVLVPALHLADPPAWNNPTASLLSTGTAPSSQALAGNLPGYPRSEAECRKGAVIASTKPWGAGSCCLEPPRRALSPSGPPQGPSLYLAKPGNVGGASAGSEMACHLEEWKGSSQGLGTESGDQDVPL